MRGVICFGLLVVVAIPVRAAEPAGATPPAPLEPLILQLGHRDYRQREAAGKLLEERGEESLPILRKSIGTADPEIKRRVAVLTQRIERKVLLSPKRVTIELENRPFKEAIDELVRQSGYRVTLDNPVQQQITLRLKNVSFWEALDKICHEGGLVANGDDSDNSLRLTQQDSLCPYIVYSGPYRIMGTNMNSNRMINLAFLPRKGFENVQQAENLTFTFQINSEPKAPLLGIGSPTLTKAEDQNGQSLMFRDDDPNNPYRANYFQPQNFYRASQMQSQLQLQRATRNSTKAKVIAGKVPIVILSEMRAEIVVDKILKVKDAKYHGQTVDIDIETVTDGNSDVQISMTVRKLGKNISEDENWVNSVYQRLELTDAKGRRLPSQGINNFINSSPAHIQAVFQFGKQGDLGPPHKLVYNHWSMMHHDVEFEFRDIPLP